MRRLRRLGSVSIAVYAAIVLAAVFCVGLGLGLAGRDPWSAVGGSGGGKKNSRLVDRFGPDSSYFYWQRTNLPHAQDRAPGLSPFGDAFRTIEIPRDRHGLVLTPLGFLDLKNPRALDALPPGLKRSATHVRAGRGGLAPGANIVQESEAAVAGLRIDPIELELERARTLAALPPAGAVGVRVTDAQAR